LTGGCALGAEASEAPRSLLREQVAVSLTRVASSGPASTRFGACAVTMTHRIAVRGADVVSADRRLGPPLTPLRTYLLAAMAPVLGSPASARYVCWHQSYLRHLASPTVSVSL
jgi:hypothetical protein